MGPIVRSLRLDLVGGVGLTQFVKSQESCRHCHSGSGEYEKTNTKGGVSHCDNKVIGVVVHPLFLHTNTYEQETNTRTLVR